MRQDHVSNGQQDSNWETAECRGQQKETGVNTVTWKQLCNGHVSACFTSMRGVKVVSVSLCVCALLVYSRTARGEMKLGIYKPVRTVFSNPVPAGFKRFPAPTHLISPDQLVIMLCWCLMTTHWFESGALRQDWKTLSEKVFQLTSVRLLWRVCICMFMHKIKQTYFKRKTSNYIHLWMYYYYGYYYYYCYNNNNNKHLYKKV